MFRKRYIYLIITILFCLPVLSYSQSTFAPAGSEWFHDMGTPYGIFHSYYNGDTVIDGITCRIIVRKASTYSHWSGMGLIINDQVTLYVYNNADTVFVYNYLFNRFTPLYIFNVTAGDTVHIPILFPQECEYLLNNGTDSTFSFIVDSVKMVRYDTSLLKTIYTKSFINGTIGYMFSYGYLDTTGIYADKIGTLHSGLIPLCMSCGGILPEQCQDQTNFRCYSDSSSSIKITTDTICGNATEFLPDVAIDRATNIYPNPAHEVINIQHSGNAKISNCRLMTIDGREMKYQLINLSTVNTINVADIPEGVYFLELCYDDRSIIYKKVAIIH